MQGGLPTGRRKLRRCILHEQTKEPRAIIYGPGFVL